MSNSKIRISECFTSVQGEGPKVGEPTTFLRTAGCNLRCPGWGIRTELPDGEVVVGCDSPHSVFPQIFNQPGNSQMLTVDELLKKIPEYPRNICLTGGEPLLQWSSLEPLVDQLIERGHKIEVFTNGTQRAVWRESKSYNRTYGLTYVMDYKLPSSGEYGKFHLDNFKLLHGYDAIKFVVGDRHDYETAKRDIENCLGEVFLKPILFMGVVWQKLEPTELIAWILEDRLRVRLNLQTQSLLKMDESERTAFAKLV